MSDAPVIHCPNATLAPGAQGLLRVTVLDGTAQLILRFAVDVTLVPQAFLFRPANYLLTGGERIFPRVVSVAAAYNPPDTPQALFNHRILLQLDQIGDFSTYTLSVNGPGLDPFFSSIQLRFRLACDASFDCRPPADLVEEPAEPEVAVDYLAKDYASFRQVLLDFIPTRMPAWTERSEADIGIMVLELLAATADTLSYTQDRISNEAFLETARQRRSVAGHLALIGYELDEGAAALTFLKLGVNAVQTVEAGLRATTRKVRDADAVIVFETLVPVTVRPEHNLMTLFDYAPESSPPAEPRQCCLPKGSLTADLDGTFPHLEAGAWLLFEDAAAGHAEVVRIVETPKLVSPQTGELVPTGPRTVVRWSAATPLRYEYCLPHTTVSANVVPATHGETVTPQESSPPGAPGSDTFVVPEGTAPARLRFNLAQQPLAFLDRATLALTLPPGEQPAAPDVLAPAASRNVSTLTVTVDGQPWTEKPSLLDSGATDTVFRIEVDDDGAATIVTGDGVFGLRPDPHAEVRATYRVGGGVAGNVPAGALVKALSQGLEALTWLDSVVNPVPATGGRDRESGDHARRFGPATFHDPLVLVTTNDYERAAEAILDVAGNLLVQRATTTFRWTGSWLTVFTSIDPFGDETASTETVDTVTSVFDARRLAGYDLEITGAAYLPLDIVVSFCAARGYNAAGVQKQLEAALASFFDPNNFSFGDSVFVSRLYSAGMAVPGVESVRISRLAMLHAADPDHDTARNLQQGFLAVGPDQVVQLDDDRNHPERGTLVVQTMGGHA